MASTPGRGFVELFRLGLPLALCFGILEAAEAAALRFVPAVQPMTKVSLATFWAAPVVHIVVNALAALLLALAWRSGLPRHTALAAGFFAFFGAFGVTAYTGFIGKASCVLLSLGVAVQVGRLCSKYDARRKTRTLTISLGLFVAVVTLAVRAHGSWPTWQDEVSLGEQARPNVLLIVLDTVRADRLSSYGYRRSATPAIDRIAREGTLFEQAYSSSSWTLPSHASLLTGLPASEHGAETVETLLTSDRRQLQELMRENGYATGAFVANNAFFVPERGFGEGFQVFDVHHAQSLLARTTYGLLVKPLLRKVDVEVDAFRPASVINQRFERWVQTIDDRPFFAVLNYMEAHEPYSAGGHRPDLRVWDRRRRRSPADTQLLDRAYDRAISGLDSELGGLFERLEQRSWWRRTLVVVLSDHGESIADGTFDHGSDLILEQIHVPLIIRLPGQVPSGLRVAAPVSLTDVAATVQELIGGPGPERLPGRSLTRWLSPAAAAGDANSLGIVSEVVDPNKVSPSIRMRSLVLNGYQYIYTVDTGQERLFDALKDPAGQHDLVANPNHQEVLIAMREALRQRQSQPPARRP